MSEKNDLLKELENLKHAEVPQRSQEEITEEIEKLLKKMTFDEKICQLFQVYSSLFQETDSKNERVIKPKIKYNIGSILGAALSKGVYRIQKQFLENNRLKIPLLFMLDVIHGFRTTFPIPLGLSCTWNMELIEKLARVSAKEASVAGVCVTFSPMLDLVRDPRWGRVMESPGEDPYLGVEFAKAMVRGYQGDSLHRRDTIGACAKHYCAYGAAEGGRDYNTVDMSERRLRNFYLPAFKGAVDQGVTMFMTSFNIYDGIPTTINKFLFNKVLRDEWKFQGVVISDWTALKECIDHGAVKDIREAAKRAVESTMDIEMVSSAYIKNLKDLLEKGELNLSLIDDSVRRVLSLKYKLGLFDDPYRYIDIQGEKEILLCDKHRKIAREVARESFVLLKNENILPLDKNVKNIALIGPHANNKQINGAWSIMGNASDNISLKMGITKKLGEEVNIIYESGCSFKKNSKINVEKVKDAGEKADVIILALGEPEEMSGEAKSRGFITLPSPQEELSQIVLSIGKPTVLVLFNGRPLEIKDLVDNIPAILEVWFPGTEGGNAIADVLFGDYNPSGKLTMSFPYTIGQIPVYYNYYNTGRPFNPDDKIEGNYSNYIDIPNDPLYHFGFGLSYTTFEYSEIELNRTKMHSDEELKIKITVTNTGKFEGSEVVQMYIQDLYGSAVRPIKELKGFKKIILKPGEMQEVEFLITYDKLAFWNSEMKFVAEPGAFKVYIGTNSEDVREANFELIP